LSILYKENINIFCEIAVLASTGEFLYGCVPGVSGCTNSTDRQEYVNEQDILIIHRFQQTVRTVESRTGNER